MRLTRWIPRLVACCLAIAAAGCGYSLRPPVNPNVSTVYVPVFTSNVYQRDLHLKLTEAVQQEIKRRTPFVVVGRPDDADTTLSGQIFFADKNLVLENPNNLPRQLTVNVSANVRWIDNRSGDTLKRTDNLSQIIEYAYIYPELGETTMATGFQKAIDKMAKDIVNMMEEPW